MRQYVAWGTEPLTVMLVILAALVLPLVAAAQRPGHIPRIAFLELGPASEPTPLREAFRQGLRELGWVEGTPSPLSGAGQRGVSNGCHLGRRVGSSPGGSARGPECYDGPDCQGGHDHASYCGHGRWHLGGDWPSSPAWHGRGAMSRESPTLARSYIRNAWNCSRRRYRGHPVAVLRGLASFGDTLPAMEVAARALGMDLRLFEVREPTAFASTSPR